MPQVLVGDRYQLGELLGRGGMGEVHRALDLGTGREVALKRLLASEDGNPALLAELFEREYHTLSELAHPRIIEVYDYGVDPGGPYYTMELLPGRDLKALGKLDWVVACPLLRDVASSLAIIHARRLIHADPSPQNVRCTADGRAKLLDFGALVPMGPCAEVAGTPPFVAPERMYGAPLDGRVDVYGFGALAYWVLTGRHAYPARLLTDLLEHWATPPSPPRGIEPTVPQALSELVMDCLQQDRSARPRTIGVVMERLCAIAGLPPEEHDDVAAAYLTTPNLVGRPRELERVRTSMSKAWGQGAILVLEGPPGIGRTRMLAASVLEAKRVGRRVAEVPARDAGGQPLGVVRALASRLLSHVSSAQRDAATSRAPALARLARDSGAVRRGSLSAPAPPEIGVGFTELVSTVARAEGVVLAIDDADLADPESMALLVTMTQARGPATPCLLVTADSTGAGTAALDMLRRHGEVLTLGPLTERETEDLVQSLFGAVSHSVTVARRMHSVAGGNPKALLHLATHLVESGVVRYAAGSFSLPERLLERDLPESVAATLALRFASLGADARELGAALALTDPRELETAAYPDLTEHRDRRRTFRATDQLVRIELLVPEADRYRLGDEAWRAVVEEALDDSQRRLSHARLAAAFTQKGRVNRRALHAMRSGDPDGAVRVLLVQYIRDPAEPRDPLEDYVPGVLDLLEEVADAADRLSMPAPLRVELRMKTLGASQFVGEVERFLRLAPPLVETLTRDAGLADYLELADAEPHERLQLAFGRTLARFESLPEGRRGLPLSDAIRELARLCAMHAGVSAIALDPAILDRPPDLTPLVPLSPAIAAIDQMNRAMRLLMQGRTRVARDTFLALLERLDVDGAALGALYHRSLRLGALYVLGLIEAAMGLGDAESRASLLENEPGHRVNAQRVYLTARLMRGDVDGALAARRSVELLLLEEGPHARYPGTTSRVEMQAYVLQEDLQGLGEVVQRLTQAARVYPQWETYLHVARYHQRRLQGDPAGALAALEPALRQATPLAHREWPAVAAAHVQALAEVGRTGEALELGAGYVSTCERLGLDPGASGVRQALAVALLAAGRIDEAAVLTDALVDEAIRGGVGGLLLGALHELRARVALAARDEATFQTSLQRCRAEYRPDHAPAMAARFQRLVRDGQRSSAERHAVPPPADPAASALTTLAGPTRILQ